MSEPRNRLDQHRRQRHLVLGGCGFIGRTVAERLVQDGAEVVVADRADPGALPDNLPFRAFDMDAERDRPSAWDALIDGADVVHHYAWSSIPASADKDPAADLMQNVVPTIALLDAMRRRGPAAPRLVFTSSGGTVYGRLMHTPVQETHPLQPITAYGAGKATAELYMARYRAMHGLDCRVARVSNPFGAGQNVARGQGAATAFLHKALRGEPIEIWGNGEVMRDYIHISDAASGLLALAAAELQDGPFVFNIGSGKGTTLNAIVAEIEARLGHHIVVRRTAGRPFDVPVSVLDVALARDVLRWSPQLSFADGMARTIQELRRT